MFSSPECMEVQGKLGTLDIFRMINSTLLAKQINSQSRDHLTKPDRSALGLTLLLAIFRRSFCQNIGSNISCTHIVKKMNGRKRWCMCKRVYIRSEDHLLATHDLPFEATYLS